MKKLGFAIKGAAFCLMFCLLFAACAPVDSGLSESFDEKDLGIEIQGEIYRLREDAASLIAALGDDFNYSEVVSCVYDGQDKTYEYDSITVSTVPVDGKDIIEMITITGDNHSTLRGAKIGDSLDSVKALYGDGWFDDGYLTYSVSGDQNDIHSERIQFEYSSDTVTCIYIYSPSY